MEAVEASRVVGQGLADVVAVGRQMIADPASAGKILAGKSGEIVQCQECYTCYATIRRGLACSVNRELVGPASYRATRS